MTTLSTLRIKKELIDFLKSKNPADEESRVYLDFCVSILEKELNHHHPSKSFEYVEDEKLLEMLANLGFSPRNSKVISYFIMNRDPATILDVCKKTDISRTEVYALFYKLRERGLVVSSLSNPQTVMLFPSFFEKLQDEVRSEANEKLAKIKELKTYCGKYKLIQP